MAVKCPIAVSQDTYDSVVPYKAGKKLSKLISKEQLTFFTIQGAGPNNRIDFEVYQEEIQAVLK